MRRFLLERLVDESGASGTGWVAEGIQFTNGLCALTWRTAPGGLKFGEWSSGAIYPSLAMVEKVHGHGGLTRVRFIDENDPPHELGCDMIRYGTTIHCSCGLGLKASREGVGSAT